MPPLILEIPYRAGLKVDAVMVEVQRQLDLLPQSLVREVRQGRELRVSFVVDRMKEIADAQE